MMDDPRQIQCKAVIFLKSVKRRFKEELNKKPEIKLYIFNEMMKEEGGIDKKKEIELKTRNVKKKQMERQRMLMIEVFKELKIELMTRNVKKKQKERQKKLMTEVFKELKIELKTRNVKKKQMERQRKLMTEVFKELKIEFKSRNVKKKQIERQRMLMTEFFKELKIELKSRNVKKKQMERQRMLMTEVFKELKETCKKDQERYEPFIPRKLFLFNIESFKNFPQTVEAARSAPISDVTESEENNDTASEETMPSLPKKKTIKDRVRKFFGSK
ncbi:histone-lysine N-methyltransferase, H3 lysine-79 specific-like isoform X1 [Saccostrea cucullata]|uniref:histone-lysine N-methyltransferase, H3 lysine-79 specific-like isoform X1 n=1 Tax=Saccostrea cuccullata TaxID=36930 RepID=UPI002ED348C4